MNPRELTEMRYHLLGYPNHLRIWWLMTRGRYLPSLKLTVRPWKWMVGRLLSFWDGLFSRGMLVSGSVWYMSTNIYQPKQCTDVVRNPAIQLRLVVTILVFTTGFWHPNCGCFGFLNHQQESILTNNQQATKFLGDSNIYSYLSRLIMPIYKYTRQFLYIFPLWATKKIPWLLFRQMHHWV